MRVKFWLTTTEQTDQSWVFSNCKAFMWHYKWSSIKRIQVYWLQQCTLKNRPFTITAAAFLICQISLAICNVKLWTHQLYMTNFLSPVWNFSACSAWLAFPQRFLSQSDPPKLSRAPAEEFLSRQNEHLSPQAPPGRKKLVGATKK